MQDHERAQTSQKKASEGTTVSCTKIYNTRALGKSIVMKRKTECDRESGGVQKKTVGMGK